jgi:hypothetical protein
MSAAPLGRTQATDDPTEMPRWGKVGKQRIVDEGPLPPFPNMSNVANMHDLPFLKAKYDMTTFDEVLVKASTDCALAVLRLNVSSYLTGSSTGNSAGLTPLCQERRSELDHAALGLAHL